jgi:hypothetical protein
MSVQVKIAVPAEQFDFDSLPEGVRVEFERCVPLARERPPNLWVAGGEALGDADESTDVGDGTLLAAVDGERLVRREWPVERSDVFDALAASEATCLSGFREHGVWTLTLRFPSAVSVSEWYRACPRSGKVVTVQQVQTGRPWRTDRGSKLTDRQREALRTALETGYFAIPRETSLEELSNRLDISDTATSQRLRRGVERLIVDYFGDVRQ